MCLVSASPERGRAAGPPHCGTEQVQASQTPFHSSRKSEDWGKAWQAPNTAQQTQVPTVSTGELVLFTQSDQK